MPERGKTVLVTGSTGRLGRALSKRLLEEGYTVRGLVRTKEGVSRLVAGTVPFQGDMFDSESLRKACNGVEIVFHTAGILSQSRFDSKTILGTNVTGTMNLADAMKEAGVQKMIYASSANVYGRRRRGPIKEEDEPRPTDTYGLSKAMAEKKLEESTITSAMLRLASIYGPGFESSFFKVFEVIRMGKAYVIGNGKNHLAMVHVDDAVESFLLAARKRISGSRAYNIGDGREYTQEYLLGLGADLLGVPRPERHISTVLAKIVAKASGLERDEMRFMTSDRILDIGRARKELGFAPRESVESSAGKMLSDFTYGKR